MVVVRTRWSVVRDPERFLALSTDQRIVDEKASLSHAESVVKDVKEARSSDGPGDN